MNGNDNSGWPQAAVAIVFILAVVVVIGILNHWGIR